MVFGRSKKKEQPWYEKPPPYGYPGQKAGGGGFNAFVWRSIKKIFLSLILLGMLGWSAFATNLDLAITGQIGWVDALVQSFIAALNNGYTNFIPRSIAFFSHLANQEPAQAFLLNLLPNVVVYLFTFLWVSFAADILDQRKYEAFSFAFVSLLTLMVVAIFSIAGFGISAMMTLLS